MEHKGDGDELTDPQDPAQDDLDPDLAADDTLSPSLDQDPPRSTSTALEPVRGGRSVVVYDPLRRYMQELRHFEPLTATEEKDLAIRYKEGGDLQAAYRLVSSHLRLVVKIAFQFKRSWQNLLDLIQEGNVGLLLAVQKFDPYRDIRLSTYATWWIRAYIIKFLLDNWRMVRVGTTNARRRLLFNLRKEKDALLAQGITPGPRLLAERLNVSEADVIEVDRSLGMPDLSLESPLGVDSDQVFGDTLRSGDLPADEQLADHQGQEIIRSKLAAFANGLSEREAVVFQERLLAEEPATLQALGDRFGMTREGLRQVEKRLLRKLKAYLVAEGQELRELGISIPEGTAPVRKPADPTRPRKTKSSG